MGSKTKYACFVFALSDIIACTSATNATKLVRPEADQQKMSYAIGLHIGTRMRRQKADVHPDLVLQGIREGLAAEKQQHSLLEESEIRFELAKFQEDALEQERLALKNEGLTNQLKGEAFLRENQKKPGVITMPSGVQYKVIEQDEGESPSLKDRITIEYEGRLLDGSVFGTSKDRFPPTILRLERTIKGWKEVVPLMKEGATFELYVPPHLAYGDESMGLVGPNETLIFTIHLVSIDKYQPPQPSKTNR